MLNKETNEIGYIFKRKNIQNPKIKNLLTELQILAIETNFIIKAITAFINEELHSFDSLIGDCKCQTRASILLDLVLNNDLKFELKKELSIIKNLHKSLSQEINFIDFDKYHHIQKTLLELGNLSIKEYIDKKNLTFTPSSTINILTLSFITSLKYQELNNLKNTFVGSKKINQIIDFAKKELCKISIEYEKNIAKIYTNSDIQKSLSQIESKGMCFMTPFFSSFKPIFEKMKKTKQIFIKKITVFCFCGGINNIIYKAFEPFKNTFQNISYTKAFSYKNTLIITGYQFPGSFSQLKTILGLKQDHKASIPQSFLRICQCQKTNHETLIENTEEAILANFAQHKQFTNDAEIDFEKLGLIGSDLYKEYSYLKTIPGYSIEDMSKFCIKHISSSTVKAALQSELSTYNNALTTNPTIQSFSISHPKTIETVETFL